MKGAWGREKSRTSLPSPGELLIGICSDTIISVFTGTEFIFHMPPVITYRE